MAGSDRKAPEPGPVEFIPLCVPEIRGNEWSYVKECLDTGWVSSVGSYVDRFEQQMASALDAKHAVAVVNGTAALHVALLVAGVEPDDEVLVPSMTFIAPANAVRYAGAWPVFIDAEPDYWQLDVEKVADFLRSGCRRDGAGLRNRSTGRRVRAVIPVHILGLPCDMAPLLELAREYGLVVIEDATESLGARYRDQAIGTLGQIACFSFNGNKLLTTGGGGMIVTDNPSWAERSKYLTTQAKDDPLEYIHHTIGYNYRLTNIQAAMGCAQLEQLGPYLAIKRRIADTYADAFADLPGITPMVEAPWATSAWWMYTVRVDEDLYGMGSRALLQALAQEKIQARPLWQPLHRSPAHAGAQAHRCEVADTLFDEALSLPCSVGLTEEQQARVIATVRRRGSS